MKHTISNGLVTGIKIDHVSIPELCNSCAKAKLNTHPFLKGPILVPRNMVSMFIGTYRDLWVFKPLMVPRTMYATHIDDITWEMQLFFLKKKSETEAAYKKDEAYLETQTGCCTKYSCSD
jgi:hypothetical protein